MIILEHKFPPVESSSKSCSSLWSWGLFLLRAEEVAQFGSGLKRNPTLRVAEIHQLNQFLNLEVKRAVFFSMDSMDQHSKHTKRYNVSVHTCLLKKIAPPIGGVAFGNKLTQFDHTKVKSHPQPPLTRGTCSRGKSVFLFLNARIYRN